MRLLCAILNHGATNILFELIFQLIFFFFLNGNISIGLYYHIRYCDVFTLIRKSYFMMNDDDSEIVLHLSWEELIYSLLLYSLYTTYAEFFWSPDYCRVYLDWIALTWISMYYSDQHSWPLSLLLSSLSPLLSLFFSIFILLNFIKTYFASFEIMV